MPGIYETLADLEAAKRRRDQEQMDVGYRTRTPGYPEYAEKARSELWPTPAHFVATSPLGLVPGLGDVAEYEVARHEGYSPLAAAGMAALPFGVAAAAGPVMRAGARALERRAGPTLPVPHSGGIDAEMQLLEQALSGLPELQTGIIGKPYRGWKYGDELEGFVDAPDVTDAAMAGKAMTDADLAGLRGQLLEAGHPPEWVDSAMTRIRTGTSVMPDEVTPGDLSANKAVEDIVMRIGVLNTPAVEGMRFNRVRAVMDAIEDGKAYVEVPSLDDGPPKRINIPKEIRGRKVHEFYNLPSTDPALRRPKPEGFNFPVVITGNPHLGNFVRPDPSWDGVISTVRVKPLLRGNERNAKAVADSINYAHEIGAKPLVTTFRSKSLWDLARHTNVVPNNPRDPDFDRYWTRNTAAKDPDVRKRADYQAWLPKEITKKAFREAGWESGKNIYGHGGTWWWPKGKELDDSVLMQIRDQDGPIEFCDLLGKGCTSCRNCQKTTHTQASSARIMGCTDEPFCSMNCPQCFVRRGQSGVEGRESLSVKPNAKQAGFGEPDLGDKYAGSINILQGVARRQDAPVNYTTRFLAQPTASNARTMGIVPAPPQGKSAPGQPGWEQHWGYGQLMTDKGKPAVTKKGDPKMGYLPKQAAETAYQRERMDMALSLLADGRITPEQFAVLRREIMGAR